MPRVRSEIPVGTQFSPELIDLARFLQAIVSHSGNRGELQAAIWNPPVHLKARGVPASRRRANLPLEAAVQYGLLERRIYVATELARRLSSLPLEQLYGEFARHILLECGGLRVVEAVQQMQVDGLSITADTLAHYLTNQGFRVTVHNTAINSMRMWLAKAGIFSERGWDVDLSVKERVLGLSEESLAILAGLDEGQQAFVRALCRIDPAGWQKASDVRDLAESLSGLHLSRVSLPQEFLRPLEAAGIIEFRTRGTAGGKSAVLRTTQKFKREVLEPFVTTTLKTLDPALSAYYRRRPQDIYHDLASTDRFRKGQALEAYAIKLMRILGLRFLGWRRRAADTGGAEVDVALAGLFGGIPTRWQVQCKNTPSGRLDLEDAAREIGVATVYHATHVLLIANCPVTEQARRFVARANSATTLTVFVLDRKDFEAVKASPGTLGRILRASADLILRQKTQGEQP